MMTVRIAGLVAVLLLQHITVFRSDACAAETGSREFTIQGTVTGPGGEPVVDALVAEGTTWGSPMRVAKTDKDGRYLLEGCPAGTSALTIVSKFKFTMTPQGKVAELTGTEAIEKAAPGGIGTIFGAERIVESAVAMFPPMVQIGESWKDEPSSNSPIGMVTSKATYTFNGDVTINARVLKKIGVVMDMSLEPSPSTPAKIELTSGQGSGELLFDNTAGNLVSQTFKSTMVMKVNDTIDVTTVQTFSIKTAEDTHE